MLSIPAAALPIVSSSLQIHPLCVQGADHPKQWRLHFLWRTCGVQYMAATSSEVAELRYVPPASRSGAGMFRKKESAKLRRTAGIDFCFISPCFLISRTTFASNSFCHSLFVLVITHLFSLCLSFQTLFLRPSSRPLLMTAP
jgi:hypothetical protein